MTEADSGAIFERRIRIDQSRLARPVLVVLIDAEEDFDWSLPFSRLNTSVASIAEQWRAHRVFERYGIRPTYLVDYPVAVCDDANAVLKDFLADGCAEIGTQLHPWMTPPFDEQLTERNSYAGNLPAELELSKLKRLTHVISDRFGAVPTVYRAGRYGLGPSTVRSLLELGYTIDTSIWPLANLRRFGGPDYASFSAAPFWADAESGLLELPVTRGFVGLLRGSAAGFFPYLSTALGERLRLAGIARRLKLAELITLTPEGGTHDERIALLSTLHAEGQRVFTYSYHSASLAPGNTPFVRTRADLKRFLAHSDAFFAFFRDSLHGEFITATELRTRLAAARPAVAGDAARAAAAHDAVPQAGLSRS